MTQRIHAKTANLPAKICATCQKEFFYTPELGVKRWEQKRFCSWACVSGSDHHKKLWLGKKRDPEVCRKMSENRKGKNAHEQHHLWKGNDAGNVAVHAYVRKYFPLKGVCSQCGAGGKLHMANLDGNYNRNDLTTWAEMCPKCHKQYDVSRQRCPHCNKLLYG